MYTCGCLEMFGECQRNPTKGHLAGLAHYRMDSRDQQPIAPGSMLLFNKMRVVMSSEKSTPDGSIKNGSIPASLSALSPEHGCHIISR